MFALFNADKKFIGYSPDLPNNDKLNILRKKLPEQYSDLRFWHWEGDYDSGAMVSNKKTIELDDNRKAYEEIVKTYPLGIQLFNIIKQLNLLSKNANLFDSDFKEMSNNILEILAKHNK
jgi:hypothetical protein